MRESESYTTKSDIPHLEWKKATLFSKDYYTRINEAWIRKLKKQVLDATDCLLHTIEIS